MDIELTDCRHAGKVNFSAGFYNKKGKLEKMCKAVAEVKAVTNQTIKLTWSWEKPRLWDLDQPELYDLKLNISGCGFEDEYTQQFGFREFTIKGRNFYLNGSKFNCRPIVLPNKWDKYFKSKELIIGAIKGMRKTGFNIQEFWPWNDWQRGEARFLDLWYELSDCMGWPVIANMPTMSPFLDKWTPSKQAIWKKRVRTIFKRYRNHPSILMWIHTANRFGHWQDQNPEIIGNRQKLAQSKKGWSKTRHSRGLEANAYIKKLDTTRPVTTHENAGTGDVHTINMYLNFIPLQEQNEWVSEWAKTGNMPCMIVEFGPLFTCDFRRGRNSGGWGRRGYGAVYSENMSTEYLASFFGNKAYSKESNTTRNFNYNNFKEGQLYNRSPRLPFDSTAYDLIFTQRDLFRAWRTFGFSGGIIPWDYWGKVFWEKKKGYISAPPFLPGRRGIYQKRLPICYNSFLRPAGSRVRAGGKALLSANRDTLAYIAGKPSSNDNAAFTALDHNYFTGDTIKKSIVLINDSRRAQSYSAQWSIKVAGKTVAGKKLKGELDVSERKFITIQGVSPDKSGEGVITLSAVIGKEKHKDSFSFKTFMHRPKINFTVRLFDPVGSTKKMLQNLGIKTLSPSIKDKQHILIIGRDALTSNKILPFNLELFVKNGGKLLLMAQQPQWLRDKLKWRVSHRVQRKVFKLKSVQNVICKDLSNFDLTNWTGKSFLLPPKITKISNNMRSSWGYPINGWRWGNRGAVTSAAVEKPHYGGWTPLLECGFDLADTPLMQLDFGKGRIIYCGLDLEDHASSDAAANILTVNLLNYMQNSFPERRRKTVLIGSHDDVMELKKLGLIFKTSKSIPTDTGLVIVGREEIVKEAILKKFMKNGGYVFFMPRIKPQNILGIKLKKSQTISGSPIVPNWLCCRGLSRSDLRSRCPHPGIIIESASANSVVSPGKQLARLTFGKGKAIICQLDPAGLNAEHKTYLRFTRWRRTRAICQLLTNLGATFYVDSKVFKPELTVKPIQLSGKWRGSLIKKLSPALKNNVHLDKGVSQTALAAVKANFDDASWGIYNLPGFWEHYGNEWKNADGEAVFRKIINIPQSWKGRDLILCLPPLDDFDDTFFNGVLVGRTDSTNPTHYIAARKYIIPAKLVKIGRNLIALRIFDHFGDGGCAEKGVMSLAPVSNNTISFYHPDYRTDFDLGDDPWRYFRW